MKIAFFSKALPSDRPNGVSCQVHRLANALVDKGEDVTCFTFSPAPFDARYKVIQIACGSMPLILRKFIPAIMFRSIDTSEYDILHYHGDDYFCRGSGNRVRTFYGSALYEALYARNIRRFFYQGLFYLFELVSCLKKGSKTAISMATVRALPANLSVIPCGVPQVYIPGTEKTEYPSLLFIGDLDSRKRGRFMVSVFSRYVLPVFPDAVLTVVGPQDVSGQGILHLKDISEGELIGLFQKSWIYCCTSSYEGFGAPVIEAMACGTAVIAVRNRGVEEIVKHEHDGLLCTDSAFTVKLIELIRHSELRSKFYANGLLTVKKYSMESIAQRYMDIYRLRRQL
jgi:phosphatidyl-myo-inositol alpha-mannosyltransferase